jgi:WD40 repeat protein
MTPDGRNVIWWPRGFGGTGVPRLQIWDIETQQERFTWKGDLKPWYCQVTPDGTKIVLGFKADFVNNRLSPVIVVLSLADALASQVNILFTLPDSYTSENCAITRDGKHLISVSYDNNTSLNVWDLETGELITTITTTLGRHDDELAMCAISPDRKHLVSVAAYGTLTIWNCATWRELAILEGHKWHVFACTFTPDGKYVVSGSNDCTLRIWSVANGCEVSRLEGVADFTSIVVAPNSRDIIAGDYFGNIHFLEFNPGHLTKK